MTDGYGSHLAMLEWIGKNLPVRRVIEFGSGEHSTLAFLDREKFPSLEGIVSFESDPAWASRLEVFDGRLKLIVCSEDEALTVAPRYTPADLVFVDGRTREWRIWTALEAGMLAPLVVLHDAEKPHYRRVFGYYGQVFIYDAAEPWTALMLPFGYELGQAPAAWRKIK